MFLSQAGLDAVFATGDEDLPDRRPANAQTAAAPERAGGPRRDEGTQTPPAQTASRAE